jgi:hypothetical protein
MYVIFTAIVERNLVSAIYKSPVFWKIAVILQPFV